MEPQTIVVVGASAGGVEALGAIAAGLPAVFPAAVFVVLHIGAHTSILPEILSRRGPLPAVHPTDGDPVCGGRIYVAPPDHHMTLDAGLIRLTKGPRENLARPAIDPLFRSAAAAFGSDVVGVILTGGLNDGTAGLFAVKQHGGVTVVQDPDDSVNASMPSSALAHVAVDHCLPLADIAPLLARVVSKRARASLPIPQPFAKVPEMTAEFTANRPVAITCPDCGGALRQEELGRFTQFACHIGHRYTVEVMLAAQFLAMERFIESALRSMNERAELCRQMADKTMIGEALDDTSQWAAAMREAKEQEAPLRELLEREWIHPVNDSVETLLVS